MWVPDKPETSMTNDEVMATPLAKMLAQVAGPLVTQVDILREARASIREMWKALHPQEPKKRTVQFTVTFTGEVPDGAEVDDRLYLQLNLQAIEVHRAPRPGNEPEGVPVKFYEYETVNVEELE